MTKATEKKRLASDVANKYTEYEYDTRPTEYLLFLPLEEDADWGEVYTSPLDVADRLSELELIKVMADKMNEEGAGLIDEMEIVLGKKLAKSVKKHLRVEDIEALKRFITVGLISLRKGECLTFEHVFSVFTDCP